MDNFPLKKPNEQTNYKFEQKKTNSGPILAKKKMDSQKHHFHIS